MHTLALFGSAQIKAGGFRWGISFSPVASLANPGNFGGIPEHLTLSYRAYFRATYNGGRHPPTTLFLTFVPSYSTPLPSPGSYVIQWRRSENLLCLSWQEVVLF